MARRCWVLALLVLALPLLACGPEVAGCAEVQAALDRAAIQCPASGSAVVMVNVWCEGCPRELVDLQVAARAGGVWCVKQANAVGSDKGRSWVITFEMGR